MQRGVPQPTYKFGAGIVVAFVFIGVIVLWFECFMFGKVQRGTPQPFIDLLFLMLFYLLLLLLLRSDLNVGCLDR